MTATLSFSRLPFSRLPFSRLPSLRLPFSRKSLYAATGLTIALAVSTGALAESNHPATHVVAQCDDADTEDSFSMSCTPNIIPDTSDELTEAEVAEPGFNAKPGGFGGEGGGFGGEGGGFGGEGGGHGGGGGGGGHGGR